MEVPSEGMVGVRTSVLVLPMAISGTRDGASFPSTAEVTIPRPVVRSSVEGPRTTTERTIELASSQIGLVLAVRISVVVLASPDPTILVITSTVI